MKATLDLLYVGTIRRLFPNTPKAQAVKPSPLAPPDNYYACVHVETVMNQASGEVDHVRCGRDSAVGFLCHVHDNLVLNRGQFHPDIRRRVTAPERNTSAEVIDNILKTEERALREVEREVGGVGRARITFVKGLRMNNNIEVLDENWELPYVRESA
jgi:hypothetical protein